MPGKLTFFHNPRSRAEIVRWMLEEVGADYDLKPIDFQAGDNRKPEFLEINPMGKIPTIVLEDGTVITEAPAIIAWLADAYPEAGLAPEPHSSERGSYYRWLFFGGSCFEPALAEKMMRKDVAELPKGTVGWGSYDDVIDTLERALANGPSTRREIHCRRCLYRCAIELGWVVRCPAHQAKPGDPELCGKSEEARCFPAFPGVRAPIAGGNLHARFAKCRHDLRSRRLY